MIQKFSTIVIKYLNEMDKVETYECKYGLSNVNFVCVKDINDEKETFIPWCRVILITEKV